VVAANAKDAIGFLLSGGDAHDAPKGRDLLRKIGPAAEGTAILMDRAYEGKDTRELAASLGYTPVVPPKKNRRDPWDYDRELYKRRNEVERFFRRYKSFRRVCTRYDKLDRMFLSYFLLALIYELLR
jgi:transposase